MYVKYFKGKALIEVQKYLITLHIETEVKHINYKGRGNIIGWKKIKIFFRKFK